MLHTIETEIKLFCAQFGENPPVNITFDKTVIRWGKKNHMWGIGHRWEFKGEWYYTFDCGTWKDPSLNQKFTSWDKNQKMTPHFHKVAREQQAILERRTQDEKDKKHAECVEKWQPIFDKAKKGEHPYLEKKGILPFNGRVTDNGALIYKLGKTPTDFIGAQQIYLDSDNKFQKRFTSGLDYKGSHHTFKDYRNAEYIYLGEGIATMASIQQAKPQIPCVAAMAASNMPSVIENIREQNPRCKIILTADDDPNDVGMKYARICRNRFKDVVVIKPKFPDGAPKGTDFNDLHNAVGISEVKKQLAIKPAMFYTINCLGLNGNNYYYTSSENPQIVELRSESHSKVGFRRLCADNDFWTANYGVETQDKDGGITLKVSYDLAASDLMKRCHDRGEYKPDDVRGTGIYPEKLDNGSTVYVVNNGATAFNQPEHSKYYYIKKPPFSYKAGPYHECLNFMGVLAGLATKTKIGGLYLAAAYVQSFIFPVLPWRFHLWVTGQRGAGKSTVMDFLNRTSPFIELVQDTSAAGLRQGFGSDQKCIVYDEAEPSNKKVPAIIDLARESSSNSGAKFLRGTVGGKAIHHNSQFNFIMSSIQIPNLNAAEASRFLFVELVRNKNQTKKEFKEIKQFADLAEKNSLHFFHFLSKNVEYILEARELARDELLDLRIEARQADQLSTVIACLCVVGIGEASVKDTVNMVLNQHDWVNTDYIDESNISDADNAFRELMEIVISPINSLTVERALTQIIYDASGQNYDDYKQILAAHGMAYVEKTHELFVYHLNSNLINALTHYPNLMQVIHRDQGIETVKGKTYRLNKGTAPKKGYLIKLDGIFDRQGDIKNG